MGSSISGLFQTFLLLLITETTCTDKLSFKPLFFYKYVDDIIIYTPKNKIDEMINVFNFYDERLQFTYETEIIHKRILDVLILLIKTV